MRSIGFAPRRRYPPPMGSFNVALLEALLSAGVSPERARAVVDLLDRSIDERYSLHAEVLATKRDVAELNVALSREIAEVKAGLSREIADTRVDLLKWVLGALTAQTALLLGAGKLF
jgi:hypothetical protein